MGLILLTVIRYLKNK